MNAVRRQSANDGDNRPPAPAPKIPTKRRRRVEVGRDVVVFEPFVYERGAWRGRQYPIYRVFLNGAEVAWIEYERGIRAGHYLMTNGVGWTRLTESRSWPAPSHVWSLSPFSSATFADLAARLPEWAASGTVMTKAQQGEAVIAWQAAEDQKAADQRARWAQEATKKAEAAARAHEAAEVAAQERREQAVILQGLLDRLQAAANLSNAEGAALADAIARAQG